MKTTSTDRKEAIKILRRGGVGLMSTDTLYGVSASALLPKAVERVYRLRRRDRRKPMIVLISSRAQLKKFGIFLTAPQKKFMARNWPGRLSIVLPCAAKRFHYLHRGKKSLAFRLPAKPDLRRFLQRTGPLTSASANPQGEPPAFTAGQAKKYFGNKLDFYLDSGKSGSAPSTLVDFTGKEPLLLRRGAARVKN